MGALLFDLDGTLIDSVPELHTAANMLLKDLGHAPQTRDQVQSYVGNGAAVLTQKLLVAAGYDTDEAADPKYSAQLMAHYSALPPSASKMYDGARAELERLRGLGHRMAICTNKPAAPARAILNALGLMPLFDLVVGGDSFDMRKPDRGVIDEIKRRIEVEDCLLVGDSEVDAATALAADIPFILYTEGYRQRPAAEIPHDAVFSEWSEFATALRRVYL